MNTTAGAAPAPRPAAPAPAKAPAAPAKPAAPGPAKAPAAPAKPAQQKPPAAPAKPEQPKVVQNTTVKVKNTFVQPGYTPPLVVVHDPVFYSNPFYNPYPVAAVVPAGSRVSEDDWTWGIGETAAVLLVLVVLVAIGCWWWRKL